MGIYTDAIASLRRGKTVQVTVTGGQLAPRVPVGTILSLIPTDMARPLKPGDVVLYRADNRDRLLLVKSISVGRIKLGTADKPLDGWAGPANIYGVALLG
jgi:hypothetical protein